MNPRGTRGFWEYGYQIFDAVFTAEEVDALRRQMLESKGYQGDLLSHPELREVVLDTRVVSLARSLLEGQPVYFGDSSCSTSSDARSWHKDNPIGSTARLPIGRARTHWFVLGSTFRTIPAIRAESAFAGALTSFAGTHPAARSTPARESAVWSHGTCARRIEETARSCADRRCSCRADSIDSYPRSRRHRREAIRLALFMTFGAESTHLDRFIQYLTTRTYAVERWQQSRLR